MVNSGMQTLVKRRRERLQTLLEQLAQHGQRFKEHLATPGILAKGKRLAGKVILRNSRVQKQANTVQNILQCNHVMVQKSYLRNPLPKELIIKSG